MQPKLTKARGGDTPVKAGKRYRRRDGKVVTITPSKRNPEWPYEETESVFYAEVRCSLAFPS